MGTWIEISTNWKKIKDRRMIRLFAFFEEKDID